MTRIRLFITKNILARVLRRACEPTIPRSGESGARVNCFVARIDRDSHPYLVLLAIQGNEVNCSEWDGTRFGIDRTISVADLPLTSLRVTHYYGLSEVRYSGLFDFAIKRLTCWPYIKIHFARLLSDVDGYFFNKKKLITKQQLELLKFMVAQHLDGKTTFDSINLMTGLYSIRWVEHPDRDAQQHQLEFYLESMVETGELRRINHDYQLTGHAVRAIEEYEEQERKHTENVKMQRAMLWLTLVIAAFTAVQAGVIKLPTLLDLTK